MPQSSANAAPQQDLGAMVSRLLDAVTAREAPILAAHGLSIWEYVIASRLADEEGVTQKQLAASSRRDPTRLGAHLDALGDRGLVDREVDDGDRRRRLVRLTPAGHELLGRVRRDIAAMEDDVLGGAATDLRSVLTAALDRIEATGQGAAGGR